MGEVIKLFFTELFGDLFKPFSSSPLLFGFIPWFLLAIAPAIAAFVLFVIKKRWSWAFLCLALCFIIGQQKTEGMIVAALIGGLFLWFAIWTMNSRFGAANDSKLKNLFRKIKNKFKKKAKA